MSLEVFLGQKSS